VGAFLPWTWITFAQLHWNRDANPLTLFYWASGGYSWLAAVTYLGVDLLVLLSVGRFRGLCSSYAQSDRCWLDAGLTGFFYIVPLVILSFCLFRLVPRFRAIAWEGTEWRKPLAVCLLWILCVFIGPLALDMLLNSHAIKFPRYFISASAPVYLIVAAGLNAMIHKRLSRLLLYGILAFLFCGTVFYMKGFSHTLIFEQEARAAARYLDHASAGEDLVLLLNPGPNPMDLANYLQTDPDFARLNIPQRWQNAANLEIQLQQVTTGRKRAWYVDDHGPEADARRVTLSWLRTHYREIEVKKFKNLDLILFSSH
jgi:hypothetical protein